MRKAVVMYDDREGCLVPGEFRSVQELDNGVQLGYFESADYGNKLVIMVLYPDNTYRIAEWLDGMLTPGWGRPSLD